MFDLVTRRQKPIPKLEAEMAEWYSGCTFTSDATTRNALIWDKLLRPIREKPIEALEVGTWEGRSAIFILSYLPRATITCIDTFRGSGDNHGECGGPYLGNLGGVEGRFDHNLRHFDGRVTKIRDHSVHALHALAQAGKSFDLIYVDANHRTDDVMLDSILAWRVLRPNGIMIWDDYTFGRRMQPEHRPQPAIEFFLRRHRNLKVIHFGYQVAVRKTENVRKGPFWLGTYKLLRKLQLS